MKKLFDLEKQFAYYSAYHRDPVNIWIHNLVVWPIFFTFQLLLCFAPPLFGVLFTAIHALCYVALDFKAGSFAALLCLLSWLGASSLAASMPFSLAWKLALAVQFVSWGGQVFGHGLYEKRAPSRNLLAAAVMAPFFVLLELFHSSFGYEPYPGFAQNVKPQVDAEIKLWRQNQQNKNKIA